MSNLYAEQWLIPVQDLLTKGKICGPRGKKTLEIENYSFSLDTKNMFFNFPSRKLNLKYLAGEFVWYLSGDRDSDVIEHYSKFWKKIKNSTSPYYNSNYGYAIFTRNQFSHVINSLILDSDSRQAVIVINDANVMMSNSLDKICTYSISFRIRNNCLNMTVNMRSNDIIRGTSIDAFQFLCIYDMVYVSLLSKYPDLQRGSYHHSADSFHVYEEHFEMLEKISTEKDLYTNIEIPNISSIQEIEYLTTEMVNNESNIRSNISIFVPENYKFSNWLCQHLRS